MLRAGCKYGNPLGNENDDTNSFDLKNTNQEIYRNERQTWSVGLGKEINTATSILLILTQTIILLGCTTPII